MASLAVSNCCAQGFKHTGQALGKLVDIAGINTYVTGDETLASKKFIYLFTDVLGHKFINIQLIADQYAKNGYFVAVPDLFNNDPVPLNPSEGYNVFTDWFPNHGPEITQLIVDKFVDGVKTKYSPEFSAGLGYCFGAKFAVRLLGSGAIDAASVFHPSLVTIDEIKDIKGPLFIAVGENDQMYPADMRHQTEAVLKELGETKGIKYRQNLLHDVGHGFAVRGDISDPWVKFSKEQAFYDAVAWFNTVHSTK